MKVGNIPELSGPDLPRHVSTGAAGSSSSKPVTAVTETDRVDLSPASQLASTLSPDGDIRAEKVAEVKNAIASGEFKIDISAVADRMINESASLVEMISAFESLSDDPQPEQRNSQEKFGAGPANERTSGPDR